MSGDRWRRRTRRRSRRSESSSPSWASFFFPFFLSRALFLKREQFSFSTLVTSPFFDKTREQNPKVTKLVSKEKKRKKQVSSFLLLPLCVPSPPLFSLRPLPFRCAVYQRYPPGGRAYTRPRGWTRSCRGARGRWSNASASCMLRLLLPLPMPLLPLRLLATERAPACHHHEELSMLDSLLNVKAGSERGRDSSRASTQQHKSPRLHEEVCRRPSRSSSVSASGLPLRVLPSSGLAAFGAVTHANAWRGRARRWRRCPRDGGKRAKEGGKREICQERGIERKKNKKWGRRKPPSFRAVRALGAQACGNHDNARYTPSRESGDGES